MSYLINFHLRDQSPDLVYKYQMKEYYVYALTDPRKNDAVFYIGKGKKRRWEKHLQETYDKTANRHKWAKITAIRRAGMEPGVVFVETNLDEISAYRLEQQLIMFFGRAGADPHGCLTNICEDARPPSATGRIWSVKSREKLSASLKKALKGKKRGPYTEAHRARISEGLKARAWSPSEEQRAKQRSKMQGRINGPLSDTTKALISQANVGDKNGMFGKTHSDEAKNAIANNSRTIAAQWAETMRPVVIEAIATGTPSQAGIAAYLNSKGLTTRQGATWGPGHISLLLKRLGIIFGNLSNRTPTSE
jgi:hypothetical protein